MTKKIGIVSFEYTAEFIETAGDICQRLGRIGYKYFNVTVGEESQFLHPLRWTSAADLMVALRAKCEADPLNWGDIYAT